MKKNTMLSNLAGGILDRSEMVKTLAQATTGLLPEDSQLSSAALERIIGPVVQALESMALRMGDQLATQLAERLADEKLIGAVTQIADALVLRASDQFAGQIAKRLADSQVTNAIVGKVADQIAEKFAARFGDEKFMGAVAGQFAAAFGGLLQESVAVLQIQPQPAKGKRKA